MQGKKIAILQSNYIPWKGYFDIIASVDEFILYDDMQYTRRDWRNRNQIKTPQGIQWLTIPVIAKGKYLQKIRETQVAQEPWAVKHWKTIVQNYHQAPYFTEISAWLAPLYTEETTDTITTLNRRFIDAICAYLHINTPIVYSWDYALGEGKTERLIDLCQQAGATEYISGPSAKSYIDAAQFQSANIKLSWFDYDHYPPYTQLWGEFTHGVTILDLLFNCGPDAYKYMKYVKPCTVAKSI